VAADPNPDSSRTPLGASENAARETIKLIDRIIHDNQLE